MTSLLLGVFGGLGLFLLGMVLLTDGLKDFAGDGLRSALVKFTGTPLKAFLSGTLITLLVQSSSATTVTVIGFVSAGLLTFPQALGIVFGASLGTTGTGWIVSVLGLKVSLGTYALPIVGLGAFLKLLGRGRWQALGVALAGFGLIFAGIENLQLGMQAVSNRFELASLPAGGLVGHLLAMGVGLLLTMVLQSSSAAVATTLTALHSGALNFEQAASLVIGAAIGTTVTAALAAIGSSIPARRTALAFVVFNSATGLVAILLLPVFLVVLRFAQEHLGLEPGAVSLAAFHTLFIAMGVALFLPWVHEYAHLIEKVLPDRGPQLTRHLDRTLFSAPGVALETCRRTLREIYLHLALHLQDVLHNPASDNAPAGAGEIRSALLKVRDFLSQIPAQSQDRPLSDLRISLFHAVDHLMRLEHRLDPSRDSLRVLKSAELLHATECLDRLLTLAQQHLRLGTGENTCAADPVGDAGQLVENAGVVSRELAAFRKNEREKTLAGIPARDGSAESALLTLDALRWTDRTGYHLWRALDHLAGTPTPPAAEFENGV